MALLYILVGAVMIASSAPAMEKSATFHPVVASAATFVSLLLFGVLVVLTSRETLRKVQTHARFQSRAGRGYIRMVLLHRLLIVATYAAQVYVLRWPQFVYDSLGLRGAPIVDDLLVLGPFVVMLLLSWIPLHQIDNMVGRNDWTFGQYALFQTRHYVAIVIVPWLVFVSGFDLAGLVLHERMQDPNVYWPIAAGMVMVLYISAPVGLRYLWYTCSLPAGELRSRLRGLCDTAKLRCRDILVWRTGAGQLANACIAGIWHRTRYIFLTDRLLRALSPGEVEAVFAHEIGHVKHRHMLYYIWFTANFVLCHTVVEDAISPYVDVAGSAQIPVVFTTAFLYWYVLFGFVSRRQERQADLFAVSAIGSADAFISSLQTINVVNGTRLSKGSWRHFSMANRIHFLQALKLDIDVGLRFRRDLVCIYLLTLLVTATCGGYVLRYHVL